MKLFNKIKSGEKYQTINIPKYMEDLLDVNKEYIIVPIKNLKKGDILAFDHIYEEIVIFKKKVDFSNYIISESGEPNVSKRKSIIRSYQISKFLGKIIEKKKEKMKKIDIYEIIKGIYEDPELRRTCIPLFLGNPSLAKTLSIQKFADDIGVHMEPVITSTMSPNEATGMAMPDQSTKRMCIFDFDKILNLKDGDILFLDELLNGSQMVLNAWLTVLENRVSLSGVKLPEIMIVAAANPQGALDLLPQQKQRFVTIPIKYDSEGWYKVMKKKFNMPKVVFNPISNLVEHEKFLNKEYNYHTSRSIERAILSIIRGVYTPYEEDLLPILNLSISNPAGKALKKEGKIWWEKDEIKPYLEFIKEFYDKINK